MMFKRKNDVRVSRKSEESVIVDGFQDPEHTLKVTVLEVRNGKAVLGFEVNSEAAIRRPKAWNPIRGIFIGRETAVLEVLDA